MATTLDSGTASQSNYTNNDSPDDNYNYYDDYMYIGYPFERPVFLYVIEILVIITSLVNVVVVFVLLRRKMRNATNMILAAIAVSDSLTGLVLLPTYIIVYSYDPFDEYSYGYNITAEEYNFYSYEEYNYYSDLPSEGELFSSSNFTTNKSTDSAYMYDETHESEGAYPLSKSLCRAFMFSKFFFSKSFHSVSIFLTLFLGIQRYVSVAFPFKSQSVFSVRNTILCCVGIFLLAPVLHSFHLFDEKASAGICQWSFEENSCSSGCIYMWFAFFLRHLIPCITLLIFTILFIKHLRKGERNLRRMDSNVSQMTRRVEENRRITVVVTAIVVVFLVPEIPYGIFLAYNAFEQTINNGEGINLETNRAIHVSYEILLVLSFHANFYIYLFLNKRFRKCLYRTFVKPIQRYVGDAGRLSVVSRTSSMTQRSTRKTDYSSKTEQELHFIHRESKDKSATPERKFMESFSVDILQRSGAESGALNVAGLGPDHEHKPLMTKGLASESEALEAQGLGPEQKPLLAKDLGNESEPLNANGLDPEHCQLRAKGQGSESEALDSQCIEHGPLNA